MGAGGVPNRTVEIVYGRSGDLPSHGAKPNSRYDLIVDGIHIQSRWFDDKGDVIHNRDYIHQNPTGDIDFPHDHEWHWSKGIPKRHKEHLKPDYEHFT